MANSGRKTPAVLFRLLKECMRMRKRPTDVPEPNAPFIVSVEVRCASSYWSRMASPTQGRCLRGHYIVLVRGAAKDDMIKEIGLTKQKFRSIWHWLPELKCLDNDVAWLSWLVLRAAQWVGQKLYAARIPISTRCLRCGDWEKFIGHAVFHGCGPTV